MQERNQQFRLLVEGVRDYAMLLLEPDGRITFWNVGAEQLFGWTADEAVGQSGAILFLDEDRRRGMEEQERRVAAEAGRAVDRRWHRRKDGSQLWADGLLMRLSDASGQLCGFAKIARDATAERKAEEELRTALDAIAQANEALEQRVSERTQSLSQRTQELTTAFSKLERLNADLEQANRVRSELLHRLVNAQEEERGQLARELHDNVGQLITALSLGLHRLTSALPVPLPERAGEILHRMQRITQELGGEAHRLSASLRPAALDEFGLMPALKSHVEQWSEWTHLPVEISALGPDEGEPVERLPGEVELAVYRIVQEALTNVVRHGRGSSSTGRLEHEVSRVGVLMRRTQDELTAIVEDDGPGFDVEAALRLQPDHGRLGLLGMRQRAELVGGTLEIESRPGQGTTIFLRIPLNCAAD